MNDVCNDPAMAAYIMIFKNIMVVFQVIVPIILIASASLAVAQLVMNPEKFVDDRGKDHTFEVIKNKVFAAVIIFFLPFTVNMVITLTVNAMDSGRDKNFSFAACWNAASKGNGVIQWAPGGQDITPPERDNSKDDSKDDSKDE